MKQRIATAAVGLAIFFAVLALYNTILLNISAAAVIFLALYEIFHVTGVWENKTLSVVCMLFGCTLPFLDVAQRGEWLVYYEAFFALALFAVLLLYHETLDYARVATAFAATGIIGYTINIMVLFRETSEQPAIGIYYTLLAFGLAWLTDTGAYLFGITMGKHKLAPKISPKKTVEGAVGGVAFCIACVLLLSVVYNWICGSLWGIHLDIDYGLLLILAPVGSLISMLGDLSASLIKRQCGVKDYGSLMPGHGGIMDRFDSAFFTLSFLFLFIRLFPIV
ncbi:MAG: phosphatidate cytidylyltransferase [Oscillospiraceae bacterium]|nr:phosphatidate cytidylyltransferase [Oscillospiraceae bacterium]